MEARLCLLTITSELAIVEKEWCISFLTGKSVLERTAGLETTWFTHTHTHARVIHLASYQQLNWGGAWGREGWSGWSLRSGQSQSLGLGGVCWGCKWRRPCCPQPCTESCHSLFLLLPYKKRRWRPPLAAPPAARGSDCCHGNHRQGTWCHHPALLPTQQNSWSTWLSEGGKDRKSE